jgi:hypothetical protein
MSEHKLPKRKRHPAWQIVIDKNSASPGGTDIFVVFEGVRIAKRGHAGTAQAMTWVSLEPGWVVYSTPDHETITIEHNGVAVQ